MASKGESDKVDMLVGDIYGRGYSKFQLSSKTLASSFGKMGGMQAPRGPGSGVGEEDLARSLLVMITMNVGQVGGVSWSVVFLGGGAGRSRVPLVGDARSIAQPINAMESVSYDKI